MRVRLPAIAFLALAAAAGAARAEVPPQRVTVFPFTAIHASQEQQWVPKAVTENVTATLSMTGTYTPVEFAGDAVVESNAAAAKFGKAGNTPLALRGTIQIVDTQVRLVAQLIDTRTALATRTAISTGQLSDLLKLEDDLSAQLLNQKRPDAVSTAAADGGTTAAGTPAAGVGQPPVQIVIQNTPGAVQPATYGPPVSEAAYPTSYDPWFNEPSIIVIRDDHHGDHGGHDGHGGGGRDGHHGNDGPGGQGNGGGMHIVFTPGTPDGGPNVPGPQASMGAPGPQASMGAPGPQASMGAPGAVGLASPPSNLNRPQPVHQLPPGDNHAMTPK